MLIFMDESGDTGFKFSKNSSKYFVLTVIIFDNLESAEKANDTIKKLRKELKILLVRRGYYFHCGDLFIVPNAAENI